MSVAVLDIVSESDDRMPRVHRVAYVDANNAHSELLLDNRICHSVQGNCSRRPSDPTGGGLPAKNP